MVDEKPRYRCSSTPNHKGQRWGAGGAVRIRLAWVKGVSCTHSQEGEEDIGLRERAVEVVLEGEGRHGPIDLVLELRESEDVA
eukprot:51523-Hanusia_phi.AAC.1